MSKSICEYCVKEDCDLRSKVLSGCKNVRMNDDLGMKLCLGYCFSTGNKGVLISEPKFQEWLINH